MAKTCGECEYLDYSDTRGNDMFKCKYYKEYHKSTEKTYCPKFGYRDDSFHPSGCYLTTVVVNILGKEDNCPELMALRTLRCEYMQKREECRELLIKYDVLGPSLAKKLADDEDTFEKAKTLYNVYIKGTMFYVNKGEFEKAVDLYAEMFNSLIKEQINSYIIPDKVIENYDMNLAGHGKITLK